MHKIIIENECGCFRRSEIKNNQELGSKDEALSEAIKIKNKMNTDFCKKHEFQLVENANNFIISFKPEKPSSCCGTGCCS